MLKKEGLKKISQKPVPLVQWGPYLSERQWGTVREDYSPDGDAWHYFPFDHAHCRAYRWGEDGLGRHILIIIRTYVFQLHYGMAKIRF